ncbi:MAG TPA: protein translocase subunit SecF [Caulobacteraceae bacterium]
MAWPLIKHLPDKTNLRFVRYTKALAVISLLAVIASLFATLYPLKPPCGGLNCGVDFRGGTVLEVTTAPRPIDLGTLRSTLGAGSLRLGDVQVQEFGSPSEALVRYEAPPGADAAQTVTKVRAEIERRIPGLRVTRNETVGAKVSGELLRNGVMALGIAIALMLLYIWFRFGLSFGMGAVVALFHDVILTFGLFALTNLEFTLTGVAAILTVIGYSMNDTVVVLDRVRENLRKYKKMPLGELIDLSVNETLSRTVVTGVTGIMALAVMALFGGETLFPFAVAMIFGIVVGTYSSIYVAAPVLLLLGVKRGEEEAKPVRMPGTRATVERP